MLRFNEDYAGDFDAVDSRTVDFDMETVIERLDGAKEALGTDYEEWADAMGKILRLIAKPGLAALSNLSPRQRLSFIGQRTVALLWLLDPSAFDGTPSGRELGRRLGLCHSAISVAASEFTALTGIRNRAQSHGRNGLHASKLHKG
jgi:hypothetical protein